MSADRDGILLLSIPYDEGWTIKLDGSKAETFPVGDALTGVRARAGDHTVVMSYLPPGFLPGLGLTALGIALWLLCCWYVRKKKIEREIYIRWKLEELKRGQGSEEQKS